MSPATAPLCRIAAALCSSDEDDLRARIREGIDAGLEAGWIREAILTVWLFDGYPSALEGFRILAEFNLSATAEAIEHNPENIRLWRERGLQLCQRIYGPQFEPLVQRVGEFAPELQDSMIVDGYGKVLARDGMPLLERELIVTTVLAVKNRPRQLLSHCLGARRIGAEERHFRAVIDAARHHLKGPLPPSITETFKKALAVSLT